MPRTTPGFRLLMACALLAGTTLVAGCGSSERVSRTTTTEETTVQPSPITSSTTTTTTRQNQP